jgi:hypothetical protein
MSTKIYNGYRIREKTLPQIQKLLHSFRDKFEKKVRTLVARKMCEIAVNVLDHRAIRKHYSDTVGGECKHNPLGFASECVRLRRKKIKETSYRDPEFDFDCEVTVLTGKDKTLALLYTEQREITKIWESMPGVKEYGYWNNTDQPEGISNKEWDARGKEWDKALGHRPPCEVGLSFDCMGTYSLPTDCSAKECAKRAPSFESRLKRHSADFAIGFKMGLLKRQARAKGEKADMWDMFFDARKFVADTEEGKVLLKKFSDKYARMLKREYSPEDLEKLA